MILKGGEKKMATSYSSPAPPQYQHVEMANVCFVVKKIEDKRFAMTLTN